MPRSFTAPIARLTVDNFAPWSCDIIRINDASWLEKQADMIASDDNLTYGTYTGRRISGITGKTSIKFRLGAAGALSAQTRARIAKWMRSRAKHIASPRAVFEGRWFTQEFSL